MKKTFIFQQLKREGKGLKKGFTLIEILVAIVISMILLGALYAIYSSSFQIYNKSVTKAEINQNARIALDRISRDLRQSDRVTTELPIDDSDPLNPPSSVLQFQDGHNTEQIQYIRYYLQNGNLVRDVSHYYFTESPDTWVQWNAQDGSGNPPTEIITDNDIKADKITSLQFYGSHVITVKLTASDNDSSITYQTETLGRNIQ